MNYFKAEVYKIFKNKTILITNILVLIYSLYGNYVFYNYNYKISLLYENFYMEYLPLIVFLLLIYINKSFGEEINHKIFYDYDIFKMYNVKLITIFLYVIYCYFLSLILSLSISFFIYGLVPINIYHIIKTILYIMPSIIFYSFIGILNIAIFKKELWGFSLSFVGYIFINYLNGVLLLNNKDNLLYIFTLNLDFNNIYISVGYSAFNVVVIMALLYIINYYVLKSVR